LPCGQFEGCVEPGCRHHFRPFFAFKNLKIHTDYVFVKHIPDVKTQLLNGFCFEFQYKNKTTCFFLQVFFQML
jgi:hypothetical protein